MTKIKLAPPVSICSNCGRTPVLISKNWWAIFKREDVRLRCYCGKDGTWVKPLSGDKSLRHTAARGWAS